MEAARQGDSVARQVAREAAEWLGIAIASAVNVFNPEAVVLGGGISASFDLLESHLAATVRSCAFDASVRSVRIEPSSLGNDATALGAAILAGKQTPQAP